jgi:hypothetical protein
MHGNSFPKVLTFVCWKNKAYSISFRQNLRNFIGCIDWSHCFEYYYDRRKKKKEEEWEEEEDKREEEINCLYLNNNENSVLI